MSDNVQRLPDAEYARNIEEAEHVIRILVGIIKQQNSAIENHKKINVALNQLQKDFQGFENIIHMYFDL